MKNIKMILIFFAMAGMLVAGLTKASAQNFLQQRTAASKKVKIKIEGRISAWAFAGWAANVMNNPFSAEIELIDFAGDANTAPASQWAYGDFHAAIDSFGYTYNGRTIGGSRCIGSSDIALNIKVESSRDFNELSDKAQYSILLYFSSLTDENKAVDNHARDLLATKSTQVELVNIPYNKDNLLTGGSIQLTSPLSRVLKQLPGCNKEIESINATLTITKIEVLN